LLVVDQEDDFAPVARFVADRAAQDAGASIEVIVPATRVRGRPQTEGGELAAARARLSSVLAALDQVGVAGVTGEVVDGDLLIAVEDKLRAGAFDCILGREITYTLGDKERFLRALARALKAHGRLLLTDYVVEPEAGGGPELEAWQRHQQPPPRLWTLAQYAGCLTRLGFDIRVCEDTTVSHRRLIVAGWAQMLDTVDLRSLPKQHLLAIVDEAERWVRTIAALDGGALRAYRFYALVGSGQSAPR